MKSFSLNEKLNQVSAKVFWSAFVILFIGFALISFANQSELADDTRAERISQQIRCIECEGLSVAESNTPNSKTIVRDVERRVSQGESDEEIFAYYEGIYGEFIRLAPTTNSGNWIVYVVPIFGGIVFVAAIFLSVRKSTPKKILIGFWAFTIAVSVLGIALFVNDATKSSEVETASPRQTIDQLEQQIEDNPSAENYRNLALRQFDEQDFVSALINFDKAIELDDQDIVSRAYSSNILLRAEQYESALARAQSAVDIEPDSFVALYFRGVVLYLTPRTADIYEEDFRDRANADFDRVLELAPDSVLAQEVDAIRQSLP